LSELIFYEAIWWLIGWCKKVQYKKHLMKKARARSILAGLTRRQASPFRNGQTFSISESSSAK